MRRVPVMVVLAALILGAPSVARAAAPAVADVRTPGTVVGFDPVAGRMVVTVHDGVGAGEVARLRASGATVRREPGRLTTLIAAGDAVYAGGARCSLGANVKAGTIRYFISAGHCVASGATWYANAAGTTTVGVRAGYSFPGDDYGLVRVTNSALTYPVAINTYPGLLTVTGWVPPTIGLAVCRSGSTTGVRCGTITGLNQTVNYASGDRIYGLIRTNICSEAGDSGGPLYVAATGKLVGIASGGSGNCTSGGTTYFQPIGEILAAYGVTVS